MLKRVARPILILEDVSYKLLGVDPEGDDLLQCRASVDEGDDSACSLACQSRNGASQINGQLPQIKAGTMHEKAYVARELLMQEIRALRKSWEEEWRRMSEEHEAQSRRSRTVKGEKTWANRMEWIEK
jgi:hypothetical protein